MPRSDAEGTVSTFVTLSIVIVTSEVIPTRTMAGGFWSETVTAYVTTPPVVLPVVVGAMAVTLPGTTASTAPIETEAACPTAIAARSLSTTSAVTCNVPASMTIASPDGASRPETMETVVTSPSMGAVSVPSLIWLARSFRVFPAVESCVFALFRLILAWRVAAVVVAASRSSVAIATWILAVL